ncbi:MAG: NAD(+)/NADH kinase [Oligoflexales bacterium]|nr:NAD(+)/NADH kinase [Oligoflexales bacterium]
MHKIKVFYNKKASGENSVFWRKEIELKLFRSEVDFITAESRDEFIKKIKCVSAENTDSVICVGGDGTFNTILQELSRAQIPFLVVPTGTANDLAHDLGMDGKISKAIASVRSGQYKTIDLIKVNDQLMATNGGIGLVSEVAEMVNRYRDTVPGFKQAMRLLKGHTYSLMVASRLFQPFKPLPMSIESDGFNGPVSSGLLLVNNQSCIGGHFVIAPDTLNNDGHFNVTIFTHKSRIAIAAAILRALRGLPIDHDPSIITFETSDLRVKASRPLKFFGDGELLTEAKSIHFSLVPQAIKIFQPFCNQPNYAKPIAAMEQLI